MFIEGGRRYFQLGEELRESGVPFPRGNMCMGGGGVMDSKTLVFLFSVASLGSIE